VVIRRQGAGCFVTGRPSNLNAGARQRQLTDLVQRAVTETFHLGFTADEVRAAFEESLAALRPQAPPTDPTPPQRKEETR
jgi:DNA-binding transcriptional regulator YhcF (GntR family)